MKSSSLSASIFSRSIVTVLAVLILACTENNDPTPEPDEVSNLVEANLTGTLSAAEMKFLIQLSGRDIDPSWFVYDVDVYNVLYTTTYKDQEIEASGLVALPKTSTPLPMVSFQRGTIVKQSDAPSVQSKNSENVISYAALASLGFITAIPDMIGFGESSEIFHPYYIEDPTSQAVIDLLRAAATLAEEKSVAFNHRLFLAGYSQGGYATLATHKALELEPLENFELIASFPGAGGYDIASMQEYFLSQETYADPYYMAYVGMSYQAYYDEDALLENFFDDPYADRIPGLFDGTLSGGEINGQLTTNISDLVDDGVLMNSDENPLIGFLQEKFAENSLLDWTPQHPVFLYHGDADTTVPYGNSVTTYETLLAQGADPEFITLINLPGKDHGTAVEPYIEDIVRKLQSMK